MLNYPYDAVSIVYEAKVTSTKSILSIVHENFEQHYLNQTYLCKAIEKKENRNVIKSSLQRATKSKCDSLRRCEIAFDPLADN